MKYGRTLTELAMELDRRRSAGRGQLRPFHCHGEHRLHHPRHEPRQVEQAERGERSMTEIRCKKCRHYYRVMVTQQGYNPYPCCHLYEDTGRRPNILTQECFEKRQQRRKGAEHDYQGKAEAHGKD